MLLRTRTFRHLVTLTGLALLMFALPSVADATTVNFSDTLYGIHGSFDFSRPIGAEIITSDVTNFKFFVGSVEYGGLLDLDYRSGTNFLVSMSTSLPFTVYFDAYHGGYLEAGPGAVQFNYLAFYGLGVGGEVIPIHPGSYNFGGFQIAVATPEPASLALLGSGLVGLIALRRRKSAGVKVNG